MRKQRFYRGSRSRLGVLFFGAAILVALLLSGCQRPGFLEAELPDDGPPIATSAAAAGLFVEKVTAAAESAADSKRLDLTVTQEEVTSFLSIGSDLVERARALDVQSLDDLERLQGAPELQQVEGLQEWLDLLQGSEELRNLRLSDLSLWLGIREPQVYFKGDGRLVVRGYLSVLGQREPLRLVMAPRASEGELVLDFVEGTLGPLPVPELLIDQIGIGLSRLIVAGREYVEITQIRVGDGTLTLSGAYRQ
jgi:hypothetical protein